MKLHKQMIAGLCIILLGISGVVFWRGQSRSAYTEEALITAAPVGQTQQSSGKDGISEKPDSGECAVYVSGAVKQPGLYRYQGTARVCDAIQAVGGFQANAAEDSLNLARLLEDGEQICVLTKKEAARAKKKSRQAQQSEEAAEGDQGSGNSSGGKVNINTATAAELMTLPGIGEAKAALIINYREEKGKFSKIEDLMQISGIKEGIFQKIKDNITTS